MTAVDYAKAPTYRGSPLVSVEEAAPSALVIIPNLEPAHRWGNNAAILHNLVANWSSDYGGGGSALVWNIGNYIEWDLGIFKPGSWSVDAWGFGFNDRGIAQLSVNGVNLGATWDQYHATGAHTNALRTFVVANHNPNVFRITVTGKHASSSANNVHLTLLRFWRTGA